MHVLRFSIETVEPVLAARPGGDPNSAASYPYIPGSLIRGAVISSFLRSPNRPPDYDFARDETARRLFMDGCVRYLNAYPMDADDKIRLLPTPHSWHHQKEDSLATPETMVYDFSVDECEIDQPKTLRPPFCRLKDDLVSCTDVNWNIAVHTQRERHKGRATKGEGAVYRYQSLAPQQTFSAVILATDAQDLAIVRDSLPRVLWVGGARSAGYGQVQLDGFGLDHDATLWREAVAFGCGELAAVSAGTKLAVTLLSDLIARHDDGSYAHLLTPDLFPVGLRQALRGPVDAYRTLTTVGGFNRTWGLPLPQVPAMAAGSVFVFEVLEDISAEALQTLEDTGLGERLTEGFGRVALNGHHSHAILTSNPTTPEPVLLETDALTGQSACLAQQMVKRMLHTDLDRRVLEVVNSAGLKVENPPNRTQLARLRTLVLSAASTGDLPRILVFLLDGQLRTPAAKQLDSCRVGSKRVRLRRWLVDRVINAIPEREAQALQCVLAACDADAPSPALEASQAEACVATALKWAKGQAVHLFPTTEHDTLEDLLVEKSDKRVQKLKAAKYRAPTISTSPLAALLQQRLAPESMELIEHTLSGKGLPVFHLGGVTAEVDETLWRDIALSLIEGLLHRAAKEAKDA